MGFWQTGYAEFHEPSGLEEFQYSPPQPVAYSCEYCSQRFWDLEELRRHRFERHPLRQPALLIRGRAVSHLPLKVMTILKPSDVLVEDATQCTVNGKPTKLSELGVHLAKMRMEFVDLELANKDVTTQCKIDFKIAEESHLRGVEESLMRMARSRVLSVDSISRFVQDCRDYGTAMSYCDGICHYLYGVMAKERSPDSGLHPDQYAERYLRSSDELIDISRPLARSIRALIAFHFNHFDDAKSLALKGRLRQAATTFSNLLNAAGSSSTNEAESFGQNAVENLLMDQDTMEIVADAIQDLNKLQERADELYAILSRTGGGFDSLKRKIVTCEAHVARNDDASRVVARKIARELTNQPDINAWAEGILNRLKTS